jgi:tetratricopeptide (TPR) repeat protein
MRLLASFVMIALCAAPAWAAERVSVPILPPVAEARLEPLALAIQERAAAALVEAGQDEIHIKQILRMTEIEGIAPATLADDAVALRVARSIGASEGKAGPRVVYSRLSSAPGGYLLEASVRDGVAARPKQQRVTLPAGAAAAVREGGRALAALALGKEPPPVVESKSDDAVSRQAECYAILIRQPMGIENPSVIEDADLDRARAACKAAVSFDPGFARAWATLGLALAIRGDDKEAIDALGKVGDTKAYLPLAWIARFWIVTRYHSNAAGADALREAILRHPGFLLARGYLAELLNATQSHAEALAAWQDYLHVAPRSGFVKAKVAYTFAKLGKQADAIDRTREALRADPGSVALRMELGSRLLDAGKRDAAKLDEAIALLGVMARAPGARGEVVLRLAYAYLLKGELDYAEPLLHDALARAIKPSEWRTRGRAKFDLANLYLRKKQAGKADEVLEAAMKEGYVPHDLARGDLQLMALWKTVKARLDKKGKQPLDLSVSAHHPGTRSGERQTPPKGTRVASPFAISSAGEIDLERKKPAPPMNFEVLRFGRAK